LGQPSFFSQPSALGQPALSFWQHLSTHSVCAQHLASHFLPSSLQQHATAHSAIAAINNIFFIQFKVLKSFNRSKGSKDITV
jgi:hypothetical protein